ncbi:MAG: hypothetical protein GC181_02995 [Bacteroidetes bacterium]|nr:hypothetical protein [Bacteroidota bacterium]
MNHVLQDFWKKNLLVLLVLFAFGLTMEFSGCKSVPEESEAIQQLDESIVNFLKSKDSVKVERNHFQVYLLDTVLAKVWLNNALDTVNQKLLMRDSLMKKADDYDRDSKTIQQFMPHDVDAQYMQIVASQMRLQVMQWEKTKDSLVQALQEIKSDEILWVECICSFDEKKVDSDELAHPEYYKVHLNERFEVVSAEKTDPTSSN